MRLIFKVVVYTLLFISPYYTFSQEKNIVSKFIEDGNLYKSLNNHSEPLIQFKENEKCLVIDYLGQYTYKVKYKDVEGYVKDEFLDVNENMMDLYFAYEEKQRLKAIQEKEERRKKRERLTKGIDSDIIEQKQQNSLAIETEIKKHEALEADRKLQKQKDSIAKLEEIKRLKAIEAERLKQQELYQKRRLDSIAKIKETQRKQQEALETIKKLQKKNDSMAKVEEKKRLEAIEAKRIKQEQLNQKRKLDSIIKAEEEHKKHLETLRVSNEKYIRQKKQKTEDSIAKAKQELEALRLINEQYLEQRELDSIAKVRQELEALRITNEKYLKQKQIEERIKKEQLIKKIKFDSIANIKKIQKKQQEALEVTKQLQKEQDLITRVEERNRLEAIETEKTKLDTITNIKEEESVLERLKLRKTCHYTINEYDEFYKQATIRTEPYRISENLTIELYKQGRNTNIFFNLSKDLGCASYLSNNRSTVKVTLENNQTITFYHSWNIECGEFNFKGRLSNSQIMKLKYFPIKSIRFRGTEKTHEITNIDYKVFFIDKLKCIE